MEKKPKSNHLVLVLLLALVVSAGFLFKETLASEGTPSIQASQNGNHVVIKLKEWEIEPQNITLKKGETIDLTIVNSGAYTHDFIVRGFDVKTSTLSPGQYETFTFVADQPMSLEAFCSLAGHKEAGMTANFTIK